MRWQIAGLLALGACAVQRELSAPAPVDALACAVREAEEIGYQKLAGEVEEGSVRMGKYIPPPPGREAQGRRDATGTERDLGKAVLRPEDGGSLESQFRVWHSGGRLRFEVLSEREDQRLETAVTGDTSEDASRLLALCASGLA